MHIYIYILFMCICYIYIYTVYLHIYIYSCFILFIYDRVYMYVISSHTCIFAALNFTNTNIFSNVCSHMVLPSPRHVVPSAVFN